MSIYNLKAFWTAIQAKTPRARESTWKQLWQKLPALEQVKSISKWNHLVAVQGIDESPLGLKMTSHRILLISEFPIGVIIDSSVTLLPAAKFCPLRNEAEVELKRFRNLEDRIEIYEQEEHLNGELGRASTCPIGVLYSETAEGKERLKHPKAKNKAIAKTIEKYEKQRNELLHRRKGEEDWDKINFNWLKAYA